MKNKTLGAVYIIAYLAVLICGMLQAAGYVVDNGSNALAAVKSVPYAFIVPAALGGILFVLFSFNLKREHKLLRIMTLIIGIGIEACVLLVALWLFLA